MMKLYTDVGNCFTLKILVAAAESGVDKLEIAHVKPGEKLVPYLMSAALPVLETTVHDWFFSSNAICRYLLSLGGKDRQNAAVDEWMEWESSHLQAIVYSAVVSSSQSKQDFTLLKASLNHLEDAIKGTEYLAGSDISAADMTIWATLYPILCDSSPLKELGSDHPKLTNWFVCISKRPAAVSAVSLLMDKDAFTCIKKSLSCQTVQALPAGGSAKVLLVSTPSVESQESSPAVTEEELTAACHSWLHGRHSAPLPAIKTNPILPVAGERNFLITSALPYVNNVPHLGNIIGCVLSADVFSRFCRLRNYNTLFICGTDEYGTATETKAMEEGLTPQQICDKYNKLHTHIYEWFNISFDYFGRTTTKKQTDIAQAIFWKLYNNGYILKDSVDQLQCEPCNRYLADRFVEGTCPFCAYEDARGDQCDKCGKLINAIELIQPRCKQCSNMPVIRTSQHLFMDLPKLEPLLVKHLDRVFADGLWSNNAKVITKSWIRDGLKPRCISRDLKWGIPIPLEGYTDKVFYVWYDAPIGYISITANYTDDWEKWWKNPQQVQYFNFMAKDNVPFHSVIFPSSLLGCAENWTLVNHLSATEYLNYEDTKFSKSRGVGVFGNNAQDTGIPADIWRFYLLFMRPESQDSAFSWDDFMLKNNGELLNNLGNFINRALMFVHNNFGGIIGVMDLMDVDRELLVMVNRELKTYINNLEHIKLRDGIRNILSISRYGNQYMQASKPWVLVKGTEQDRVRAGTVTALAANIACLLSVMVQPYMPQVSATIQAQLHAPPECNILLDSFLCYLPAGHHIGQPAPLFQKIEASFIADLKKMFAGKQVFPTKPKQQGKASGKEAHKGPASAEEIEKITTEVTKQGQLVRQLKADKAEKAKIDEEVTKLLKLKKQFALAQRKEQEKPDKELGGVSGEEAHMGPAFAEEIEKITAAVTEQGQIVRRLKTEKVEKAKIDEEVVKLLTLKKHLALAQGVNPDEAASGSGKKKRGGKKK